MGQTIVPKIGEMGEYSVSQLDAIETHGQKPFREPVSGKENLNCKRQIAEGSVWTCVKIKNSRETHS